MNRVVRKTLVVSGSVLAGIAALWLVAGFGLALVPVPKFVAAPIDIPSAAGPEPGDPRWFRARDGVRLAARVTPGDAATTTLFLHGVLATLQAETPRGTLLLAGFSMGGGVALRALGREPSMPRPIPAL